MEKLLQLNEFFVEGGRPEISHVLLNLIQPTNETEEKEKGYFFAICEINHGTAEQMTQLQKILTDIENQYYETSDQNGRNALELVLEKINQQNLSVFNLNLSLNCTIGAIKSNEIVFSYCGQPTILLFYKNKEGVYKKMDLAEPLENNGEENQKTLFSQIVQGKVNASDFFFVSTQKITDYFNHDRLQKVITTRPPKQSSEHIHRVLSELNNGLSFGGLTIHLQDKIILEKTVEKKPWPRPGLGEKVNSLFLTEQNTANTLSPSLWENMFSSFKNRVKELNKNRQVAVSKEIPQNTINIEATNSTHLKQRFADKISKDSFSAISKIILKYLWMALKNLGRFLWWVVLLLTALFISISKGFKDLFFFAFNIKNRRRQIKDRWAQAIYSYKQNFKHLPLLTKILGILSILVLIFFIGSLIILQKTKKSQAIDLHYKQTFALIEEKLEEIEITMIYGDQIAISSSKNEIKEIFNNLNCREIDAATCRDLKTRFEDLEKEIQKFVKNPKINLLTNWNIFGYEDIRNFAKIDSRLLSYNKKSDAIYVYNLLTKDATVTLKIPNNEKPALSFSLRDGKNTLFFTENKNLYKYDSELNSFEKLSISFPNENINIQEMLVYNGRLYTLDILNNNILRHDAITSGYGLGKEWVKTPDIDIKRGVSLTIDGDLFLAKENGEIIKFNNGETVPFSLKNVEPSLNSISKIWTYSEDNFIYVLDRVGKRLIILNKDGSLKEQYTSDQFEEPTDMIIEEKNKTAYILDKGKVFQIELK